VGLLRPVTGLQPCAEGAWSLPQIFPEIFPLNFWGFRESRFHGPTFDLEKPKNSIYVFLLNAQIILDLIDMKCVPLQK